MAPKEEAIEIINRFKSLFPEEMVETDLVKECAILSVNLIINSNPHSNPFNTKQYSTMSDWIEVRDELKIL